MATKYDSMGCALKELALPDDPYANAPIYNKDTECAEANLSLRDSAMLLLRCSLGRSALRQTITRIRAMTQPRTGLVLPARVAHQP